jgi:hypothetical protein
MPYVSGIASPSPSQVREDMRLSRLASIGLHVSRKTGIRESTARDVVSLVLNGHGGLKVFLPPS